MPQGYGNAIQRDLFSFLFLPHVTSSILGQQYPKRPPCDTAAYAKSLEVLTQALGQRNLPHRLAATVLTLQLLWLSSSVLRVGCKLLISAIPNWGMEISARKRQQQNDPRNQRMCFRSLAVLRRCEKAMWRLLLSMLKNRFGGHFALTFPWLAVAILIPPSLVITVPAAAVSHTKSCIREREGSALKP